MQEFVTVYEALHKQCSYYSRHLGHAKALIGNDDWKRVAGGSMLGRVLLLGNSETTNALILFNTRMFDKQKDTIDLHKLGGKVPTEEEIKLHHAQRMKRIKIKYPVKRYFEARSDLIAAYRSLKKNSTSRKLRSLRDYSLAHNIEPSTEPERATLNDLIELTEAVNEVVDLAGYIVDSTRGTYRDQAARSEEETRRLYSVLPELKAVERENNWY